MKLNLGITAFGQTFTLKDPNIKDIGAPIVGPGKAGLYKSGLLGYNEICQLKLNNSDIWEEHYQIDQHASYAILRDQWISYENPR